MKKIIGVIVALIVVFYIIGTVVGNDEETNKEDEPTKEVVAEETEDQTEEDSEEEKVTEDEAVAEEEPEEETEAEHDEEFQFTEFLIDGITTKVNGDELELRFFWTNQSGEDDVWFERIGWVDVYQNDEILKEVSGAYEPGGNSDALREAKLGVKLPVKLIYEIESDEPIEIKFGPALEADKNRYEIIVE